MFHWRDDYITLYSSFSIKHIEKFGLSKLQKILPPQWKQRPEDEHVKYPNMTWILLFLPVVVISHNLGSNFLNYATKVWTGC